MGLIDTARQCRCQRGVRGGTQVSPTTLFLVEGCGQEMFAMNWGDGFVTDRCGRRRRRRHASSLVSRVRPPADRHDLTCGPLWAFS